MKGQMKPGRPQGAFAQMFQRVRSRIPQQDNVTAGGGPFPVVRDGYEQMMGPTQGNRAQALAQAMRGRPWK